MKTAYYLALVLTIVGGVNWGLIGLFGFDLVAAIFGAGTAASLTVYSLVGVAAVALAILSANVIVPSRTITTKRSAIA